MRLLEIEDIETLKTMYSVKGGAPLRDSLRIRKIEAMFPGVQVYAVSFAGDNQDKNSEKWLAANVCSQRIVKDIQTKWPKAADDPEPFFSLVLLDYFRMVSGYGREALSTTTWTTVFPKLIEAGYMASGTPIFVLRGLGMDECFATWKKEVQKSKKCNFFFKYKFASPEAIYEKHLLWIATEQLEKEKVLGGRDYKNASYKKREPWMFIVEYFPKRSSLSGIAK